MTARTVDPRREADVTHDLASLIRTGVLLAAQGWRDHDDADALRQDPAFRLATSSSAGLTPLADGGGLASQPTLSRFTALMAEPANLKVLREAVLEMAGRGIRTERGGRRLPCITLDVDSAPIEVHGHQPKAEWNGHYAERIYHPLITSIAETGDMLDARLRAGNVGTADGALDVILDVVDRAQKSFCDVAMVRIDAGSLPPPCWPGSRPATSTMSRAFGPTRCWTGWPSRTWSARSVAGRRSRGSGCANCAIRPKAGTSRAGSSWW